MLLNGKYASLIFHKCTPPPPPPKKKLHFFNPKRYSIYTVQKLGSIYFEIQEKQVSPICRYIYSYWNEEVTGNDFRKIIYINISLYYMYIYYIILNLACNKKNWDKNTSSHYMYGVLKIEFFNIKVQCKYNVRLSHT